MTKGVDAMLEKEFLPGTMGWSVDDLDDPRFDAAFDASNFEISDGVLTIMPPAYYAGSYALARLSRVVEAHLLAFDPKAAIVPEVDLILSADRVVKADALYLSPEDRASQRELQRTRPGVGRGPGLLRIVVPPTLVIESVSVGHERRDEIVKFGWYETFGVRNYWILDGLNRSLRCHTLIEGRFQLEASGTDGAIVGPPTFAGLQIELAALWDDGR